MVSYLETFDALFRHHEHLLPNLDKKVLTEVSHGGKTWPILCYTFGSPKSGSPLIWFVGGIHGPEVIGIETIHALLSSFFFRCSWDDLSQIYLKCIRFILVPVLNPYGVEVSSRSNPNGVDLARNAPEVGYPSFPRLPASQKISPSLPLYQGPFPFSEVETQALNRLFEDEVLGHSFVLSVDFHSGFGFDDQLWFPYSFDRVPFEALHILTKWVTTFEGTYPHHFYKISPVSFSYPVRGDIWDYFFRRHYEQWGEKGYFLPWTLEMGSWTWLKKKPSQLFWQKGWFYPFAHHRKKRVLRRHLTWFEFLIRSAYNAPRWLPESSSEQKAFWRIGIKRWYQT